MVAAHASSVKIPELSKGDARDKAAAAVGWSGPTLMKARRVVNAAKAGGGDRIGEVGNDPTPGEPGPRLSQATAPL